MRQRHEVNGYLVALAATALAFLLRIALQPVLGARLPFFPFPLAVLAASWYGGRAPGLAATVLGLLAGAFFLDPYRGWLNISAVDAMHLVGYLFVGTAFALIVGRLRTTKQALRAEGERRRHAERDTWHRAEELRATVTAVGEGVIITDAQGRVTFLNAVAGDLIGWRTEAARDRPVIEIFQAVDGATHEPLKNPALRAMAAHERIGLTGHSLLVATDGRRRPIDETAVPLRDAAGAIIGSVLVFRDVSERREQEHELQSAGRRKDEFLATLAHELRNPLAPLVSGLELLETKALLDHDVAEVHPILARQTNKLVRLVDDLMELNRIERGAVDLHLAVLDLRAVVNDAMEANKPMAAAAGHVVRVRKPLVPVQVEGDHQRLVQVLTHLLDNACKFTPSNGVIRLTLEMSAEEALIRVHDNGYGIPRSFLPHVFETFAQMDEGRKNEHSGLGIGLTVVKRLTEMHHGRVSVESVEGQGTEFTLAFPLVALPWTDAPPPGPEHDREEIGHWRMMVVDDNRDAAELLGSVLRRAGHTVLSVYSGMDALDALPRFAPQVVIMDIGMPVMDGYETATRMRQQPWGKSAVLIALSGWGQETDMDRSRRAGFDHHLVKPVEQEALEELIAQLPDKAAPKRAVTDG